MSIENSESVIEGLKNLIGKGTLGHAYVVVHPNAVVTKEVVSSIATELNEHYPATTQYELAPLIDEKGKEKTITVAQARDLIRRIGHAHQADEWKLVAVCAHKPLAIQVANCLLKTLEEPPAQTTFIITTHHPESLLATITSRCQTLYLSHCTQAQPVSYEDWLNAPIYKQVVEAREWTAQNLMELEQDIAKQLSQSTNTAEFLPYLEGILRARRQLARSMPTAVVMEHFTSALYE